MPALEDYTIGWICALPIEMAAAMAVLDEDHGRPEQQPAGDLNNYILGRVGQHNVVIACLPAGVYGTASAAAVAKDMTATFTRLRCGLMVGIGGGVPSANDDIRLGDVVVGRPHGRTGGVIQYDLGKTTPDGSLNLSGSLNKPHQALLTAVSSLQALHIKQGSRIPGILEEMATRKPRMMVAFSSPGPQHDCLYDADYAHPGSEPCEYCDRNRLVPRTKREDPYPAVFYGTIASGNQVMKDGMTRDRLGRQLGVLCFEMEAAGLMDRFPCLVIRGICDYADSHKNKDWQGYAAVTAAAYAKELLGVLPANDNAQSPPPSPTTIDQFAGASFFATSDWYGRDEIHLASLVPNKQYPNQDALETIPLEGEDVSICVDQGLTEYFPIKPAPINTGFSHMLARIFSLPDSPSVLGHWCVQASESRTYMLRQPRAMFKKICLYSHVRQWLEESFQESQPAYFITGYRTALNASLVFGTGFPPNTKPSDTDIRHIPGERIYAICYREISFRFLRGPESAFLNTSNCWRSFCDGRFLDETEGFIEADISDNDMDQDHNKNASPTTEEWRKIHE